MQLDNMEDILQRPRERATRLQTLTGDVAVPMLQNWGAGVGAGGLLAIALLLGRDLAWWSLPTEIAWRLAVYVGCGAFSLLCLVRFSSDELGMVRRAYSAGQRSQLGRINELQAELAALNDALEQAQRRTPAPEPQPSDRAQVVQDAVQILRWHYAGQRVNRRACEKRGIGQIRWAKTRQLLTRCGVLDDRGNYTPETLNHALAALHGYIEQTILIVDQNGERLVPKNPA